MSVLSIQNCHFEVSILFTSVKYYFLLNIPLPPQYKCKNTSLSLSFLSFPLHFLESNHDHHGGWLWPHRNLRAHRPCGTGLQLDWHRAATLERHAGQPTPTHCPVAHLAGNAGKVRCWRYLLLPHSADSSAYHAPLHHLGTCQSRITTEHNYCVYAIDCMDQLNSHIFCPFVFFFLK